MALDTKQYNALDLAQPTNFRSMLNSGSFLYGVGLKIAHEEAARIEHVPLNATLLVSLIKTIQYHSAGSMVPFVRLGPYSPDLVNYALTGGAGGIVQPHVQNADQARQLVKLAKFAPLGERSYPPLDQAGPDSEQHILPTGSVPKADVCQIYDVWNEHAAVLCQIEDVEGVRNVDDIAKVPGVDALMVGAGDLRASLGLEVGSQDGQEPVFLEAMAKIQRAADANGLAVLGFAMTPDILQRRIQLGWRAFVIHSDASAIYKSGVQTLEAQVKVADAAEDIPVTVSEVVPRQDINRDSHIERFPLSQGKIPAIEGEDIKLQETIAIAVYFAKLHNKRKLLGDGSLKQEAQIISWVSWSNQELLVVLSRWFLPLIPNLTRPARYDYDEVESGKADSLAVLNDLERQLQARSTKYLVSDQITLADIFLTIILSRGFELVLDPTWRAEHPVILNYWTSVAEWDFVKQVVPNFELVQKALENVEPEKVKRAS
ncbi:hypothetical protein DV735_g3155, partial [Chaetothyriales sp. CBS 134920]